MANELVLNMSAAYEDADGVTADAEVVDLIVSLTTTKCLKTIQSVGLAEEALILGDIATRGWVVLINKDPTNFINVKVGTGGAIFATLPGGGSSFCVLKLGSGAQSPYVIADTAECDLQILLFAV